MEWKSDMCLVYTRVDQPSHALGESQEVAIQMSSNLNKISAIFAEIAGAFHCGQLTANV